ncbi:MAG: hypothetical protein IKR03_03010 [Clostridia bacterium]|nr:hypothetical protein [Clostridia bacterium]
MRMADDLKREKHEGFYQQVHHGACWFFSAPFMDVNMVFLADQLYNLIDKIDPTDIKAGIK